MSSRSCCLNKSMWLGYIALAVAQACIGINVVCSKILINHVPIAFLLSTRFFLSSLILLSIMLIFRLRFVHPKHPDKKLSFGDWRLGILQGIFVGAGFNFLFLGGLQYTTATSAGIIASSLPAIIVVMAYFFLKERLTTKKVMALFLATSGILVMGLTTSPSQVDLGYKAYLGDLLIFLAMIPEGTYSIISKFLHNRMTATGATTLANIVGFISIFLFSIPAILRIDIFAFEPYIWGLLCAAAISSLMFFWLWALGLKTVPANTAALFGGIMPISTLVLAITFLNESLTIPDLIGMILIFSSMFIGTSRYRISSA